MIDRITKNVVMALSMAEASMQIICGMKNNVLQRLRMTSENEEIIYSNIIYALHKTQPIMS